MTLLQKIYHIHKIYRHRLRQHKLKICYGDHFYWKKLVATFNGVIYNKKTRIEMNRNVYFEKLYCYNLYLPLNVLLVVCVCIIFFVPRSSVSRKAFEFDKLWISKNGNYQVHSGLSQLVGAVEYTDCFSAEGYDPHPPNECPVYDTKQSDGEVPLMLELWGMKCSPSLSSLPPARSRSTWKGPICGSSRTKPCTYATLNCLK